MCIKNFKEQSELIKVMVSCGRVCVVKKEYNLKSVCDGQRVASAEYVVCVVE